jgi:hypothetical protein
VIHHIEYTILLGLGCGLFLYLSAFALWGSRAREYPCGAVVPVFFFSPWWAVLLAGIVGHVLGVVMMQWFTTKKFPRNVSTLLSLSAFVLCGATLIQMSDWVDEVNVAIEKSDGENWQKIAASGPAGEFVEANYRACMVVRTTYIHAWRTEIIQRDQNDPTMCANAVVERARQSRGDAFAKSVSAVIDELPKALALSPEANAVLARLSDSEAAGELMHN